MKNIVKDLNDSLEINAGSGISDTIYKSIKQLRENRYEIRRQAKKYFEEIIVKDNAKFLEVMIKEIGEELSVNLKRSSSGIRVNKPFNILLYGYSALVIKSLAGFRDVIIDMLIENYNNTGIHDRIHLYKYDIEDVASRFFRIFICEAQPKTQTSQNGSLVFHDGIQYALALKESGFNELYIVPDATVGTLIKKFPEKEKESLNTFLDIEEPIIHFVLLGTNGFDEDEFLHSAGHSMVVNLSQKVKENEISEFPKVILSTLTNKFSAKSDSTSECSLNSSLNSSLSKNKNEKKKMITYGDIKSETIDNNGWLFRNSFNGEHVRSQMFITYDNELQKSLYASKIKFYNTREDRIKIKGYVDVIICENKYVLDPSSGKDVFKNNDYENNHDAYNEGALKMDITEIPR